MWLALDPVDKDIGLRYWKGSHKMGILHGLTTLAGKNAYEGNIAPPVPDVETMIQQGQVELLSWHLKPGMFA